LKKKKKAKKTRDRKKQLKSLKLRPKVENKRNSKYERDVLSKTSFGGKVELYA